MNLENEIDYNILSGSRINRLNSVSILSADDMFLISQKQLSIKQSRWYFSKKLAYNDLSARIRDDMIPAYRFKSMAYESSADYSFVNHKHDYYNIVSVDSKYDDNDENIKLAEINIDNKIYTISMPAIKFPELPEPIPGEIKMCSTRQQEYIDVNSESFDGWVYTDGSQYLISDFKYASQFDKVDDLHFRVPNFTKMLYIDNTMRESCGDDILPAQNGVQPHTHKLQLKLQGSIEGTLYYESGAWGSNYDGGTHGAKEEPTGQADFTFDLDVTDLNFNLAGKIKECRGNGKITHPSYSFIPFKIYIGKKNTQ